MDESKPVIGVTCPQHGGLAAWIFIWLGVLMAGGRAVRLLPNRKVPKNLDGIIISGGSDIDPEVHGDGVYGPEQYLHDAKEILKVVGADLKEGTTGDSRRFVPMLLSLFYPFIYFFRMVLTSKAEDRDQARDKLELKVLQMAVMAEKPVLGICRGAQILNVFFGGNLNMDIKDFYHEVPYITTVFPKKKITIDNNRKLYAILKTDTCDVNSLHHQSIRETGQGLVTSAVEPNGIIQAVEHASHPFIIGVQWHPEYMPQVKIQRNIFKALVRAAS